MTTLAWQVSHTLDPATYSQWLLGSTNSELSFLNGGGGGGGGRQCGWEKEGPNPYRITFPAKGWSFCHLVWGQSGIQKEIYHTSCRLCNSLKRTCGCCQNCGPTKPKFHQGAACLRAHAAWLRSPPASPHEQPQETSRVAFGLGNAPH